jgi:phosphopantothenoylcysteine synthetase/decarboxylase
MAEKKKFRVGLGVAGGIAAYKAIEVLRLLQKSDCDVRVAMTKARDGVYPAFNVSRTDRKLCSG